MEKRIELKVVATKKEFKGEDGTKIPYWNYTMSVDGNDITVKPTESFARKYLANYCEKHSN